ncbi:MAG: DUF488 domain-containing protein [Candidatus Omnitrophica bacterium]|nr:DUF488 domain-containing protein [Candidatus Omnitrophota bacterium]
MIKVKRIYEQPAKDDGFRVLVDRLWPRGMSKEKARIDLWLKDIAPRDNLRKWFAHDPEKWAIFKQKYFNELSSKKTVIGEIMKRAKNGVTLLYAAKDDQYNNAQALKEYIEEN